MLTVVLVMWVLVVVLTGCGAAPSAETAFEPEPEPEPELQCSDSCGSSVPAPEHEVVDDAMVDQAMMPEPLTMYVHPVPSGDQEKDDDLLELTLRVIDRVQARTDARIEISETGIPIRINDLDPANGRAVSDKWCFGGGCTAEHVHISLTSGTLARMYFDNFADNSLAHEFVHVLSGWGQCTDIDIEGHLLPGHIVSNGNEHYGNMSWTDQDTELACSCGACYSTL